MLAHFSEIQFEMKVVLYIWHNGVQLYLHISWCLTVWCLIYHIFTLALHIFAKYSSTLLLHRGGLHASYWKVRTGFISLMSVILISFRLRRGQCGFPDSKVHVANMGPTWVRRPQVGPMFAPWTLLSGLCYSWRQCLYTKYVYLIRKISATPYEMEILWLVKMENKREE